VLAGKDKSEMTHDKLVHYIRASTRDVFSTMLGLELTDGEAFVKEEAPAPTNGVLALIGLAGRWAGYGTFSCTAPMAIRLASQLLMQPYEAIDEEVLDAIGEITNTVLGNVKNSLEEELGLMGLSIPTVIYGRNFTSRSVGRSKWTVVPFHVDSEVIEVHLCLTPSRDVAVRLGKEQPGGVLSLG
jgi:chemotaxis protein CheX